MAHGRCDLDASPLRLGEGRETHACVAMLNLAASKSAPMSAPWMLRLSVVLPPPPRRMHRHRQKHDA